jgi:DNA topoisomerase IA
MACQSHLGLDPKAKNRVVFNEITKDAVKNAFKTLVALIWIL